MIRANSATKAFLFFLWEGMAQGDTGLGKEKSSCGYRL
jgi:hypothetical protein